jgi:hypothetical protein
MACPGKQRLKFGRPTTEEDDEGTQQTGALGRGWLPVHKKTNVREYIESTNGKLTMHVLPGYAPDLNPDELNSCATCGRTACLSDHSSGHLLSPIFRTAE